MSTDPARAPQDFKDLYTDLVNRIREQTGVTATDNQAKRYINLALLDMHIGTDYKFAWAERSAVLRTKAKFDTGTIAIIKGSSKLIGTGTLWSVNNEFAVDNVIGGGKITINGTDEVYEVLSVQSNTQLTLNTKYVGDTVLTADLGTYIYFEDEYPLASDFLRFVDTRSFNPTRFIPIISRTDFRRRFPANDLTGFPEVATILDKPFAGSTEPVRHVRVARAPDQEYLINYDYITDLLAVSTAGSGSTNMVNDTDEPIVPYRYRAALTHYALSIWYRDKKSDLQRSTDAKGDYIDIMERMTADQEIGAPRASLRPRISRYVRRARRPYSGTRRAGISSEGFDQLRDRRR